MARRFVDGVIVRNRFWNKIYRGAALTIAAALSMSMIGTVAFAEEDTSPPAESAAVAASADKPKATEAAKPAAEEPKQDEPKKDEPKKEESKPPAEEPKQDDAPPPAEKPKPETTSPADDSKPAAGDNAGDPVTPAADPDATQPPAAAASEDAPQAEDGDDLGIQPFGVGPDGGTAPYVYWVVKDADTNALVPGATFKFERRSSGSWSGGTNADAIADCNGSCSTNNGGNSLDRDRDGGEFLLEHFQTNRTSNNRITEGNRYRVTPGTAPSGYYWVSSESVEIASGTNWTGTYNFGTFQVKKIPAQTYTLTVKKGTYRTGTGATDVNGNGTAGVKFGLYENSSDTTPFATCEIQAGNLGNCVFSSFTHLPGDVYLKETDDGSLQAINNLTTGTTSGFTNRDYSVHKVTLPNAGGPVTFPTRTERSSGSLWDDSSGWIVNRVANPKLTQTCNAGVKIAVVLDTSGSVRDYQDNLAKATTALVDGLVGTPSSVAMFSFAGSSPGAVSNHPALQSVQTQTDANTVKGWYSTNNGQTANFTPSGGTNWDDGMWKATQGAVTYDYDIVFVLTDGNPTFSNNGSSTSGSGSLTTFRELERAIMSANAIKATGARIITVGIGSGLSSHNLASVSGPDGYGNSTSLNSFDYITTGWASLEALLKNFAQGLSCTSTITVEKQSAPAGSSTYSPAKDWKFSLAQTGATSVTPNTNPQTTDANGQIKWTLKFDEFNSTATATLTETPQANWNLKDITCDKGSPSVDLTNNKVSLSGIAVGDDVKCVFKNKEDSGSVTITKKDATDSTVLSGAVFGLWTDANGDGVVNGTDAQVGSNKTTDATGKVSWSELALGKYQVREITPPTGYDLSSPAVQTFEVTTGTRVFEKTFNNPRKPGSVTWTKISDDNPAISLAGSKWTIVGPGATAPGIEVIDCTAAPCATDAFKDQNAATGTFQLNGLAWGSYTVTETTAPPGYIGGNSFTFEVKADNAGTVINKGDFVNKLKIDPLTITKTANPTFTRDYNWAIEKSATPSSARVQPGKNAAFNYTVKVTPSGPFDSNFAASGTITVTNPNVVDVEATVSELLTGCSVTAPATKTVTKNGGKATFDYTCSFANADARTNTAKVDWKVRGASQTAVTSAGVLISFAGTPTTITDASVTVSDSASEFGGNKTVNASDGVKTFTYTRNLGSDVAGGQCKTYPNTATIPKTSNQDPLSSEASVEVCAGQDLTITKNVVASLHRTYAWTLTKDVDKTRAVMGADGKATFNYTVKATPGAATDSQWAMNGKITVANPNAWAVQATVTDLPSFGTGVTCAVTGGTDAMIAANGSMTFDYSCTFTGAPTLSGTNTAKVEWNATTAGSPNSSATNVVNIDESKWDKTEQNKIVTVVDDKTNPSSPVTLGTATWNGTGTPTTFTYPLALSGPAVAGGPCVSYTNNAVLKDLPNKDSETVQVCAPGANITKSVVSTKQNADFSWTVSYDVVVKNTSTSDAVVYNLTDAFNFGTGVTIKSGTAAISGPPGVTITSDWNGVTPNTSVASGISLAAGGTHTYHVSVDVTADSSVTGANLQCTPNQAGGFRNTTAITFPGGSASADACSQPAAPTVKKTGQAAVQDILTGDWTVSYQVVVSNTGDKEIAYQVTDTAAALPTGLSLVTGWSATGPTQTDGTSVRNPSWAGSGQLATGTLPAGKTHTYTVTAKVKVGDDVKASDLQCAPNGTGGVINTATVSNGTGGNSSTDCVGIIPGAVTVAKADGVVKQLADFTWQIDYAVTVSNNSGVTTKYTLSDTPQLGAGFDLVSGTWVGTAPVADKVIANGATDSYTYRVVAKVNPNVTSPSLKCVPGQGGAFFNRATVTFPGGSNTDTGCAEPASPKVAKTAADAVQDAVTGDWTVSYQVVVSNTSGKELAYKVTDTPAALPGGVTLSTPWSVGGPVVVGGGSGTLTSGWTGTAPNTEVAKGTVPNNATHTYTVTAKVKVGLDAKPEDLKCSPTHASGIVNNASVSNGVGGADASACTDITPGSVSVDKSDGVVTQLADFTWSIDYTVKVKNTSGKTVTYGLVDAPNFGSGFTVVSKGWFGTPPGTANVIADGATDTYIYRVVASFNSSVKDPSLKCVPGQGGAFFNSATVSFPGGSNTDTGCAEPASPTVAKTAAAATQNTTTGAWTLSYTVKVTNGSGIQLAYDLSDTAAALPSGVTGGTWSASGPSEVTGSATLNSAWAGSGQLATGVLPAGTSHTYTVSRVVNVAPTVPDAALKCSPTSGQGGGIWNSANVTNGTGSDDDSDCSEIKRPDVNIAKTVTNTKQLADGKWQITYNVAATNTSASLAAVYALGDTLKFGGDIVVNSATWSGPTSGTFTGNSAVFTTSKVLAPSAVDTYQVTVKATINAEAWDGTTLTCQPGTNPNAGGFLNTAKLTVNGSDKPAKDCSEPKQPTITKTAVGATQKAGDASKWLVSYDIKVTSGGFDTFYDLSDTPGFASGITLGAGTAQRTDISGQPVNSITSGAKFVTGQALAAGATHTYRVIWEAEVTDSFPGGDLAKCGEVPTKGQGFFNSAILTVGGVTQDDDTCIPVKERVIPSIDKSVVSTTQGSDGVWTIVYNVKVTLPSGDSNPSGLSAKYDLSDTLNFGGGITVNSAAWTGPASSSGTFSGNTATLASGKTINPGDSPHVYTVTVKAGVTTSAFTNGTVKCVVGAGKDGSGFLNQATLHSGGQTLTDDACSEPAAPSLVKTGQVSTHNPDGTWSVSYLLTVSNPGAAGTPAVNFNLVDKPADLPTGVTLASGSNWTAEAVTAGAPAVTTPARPGSGDWQIATGSLVVGQSATYKVSVKVNVALIDGGYEFEQCQDTEGTGIALLNGATVTSGGYQADDDACTTVLPPQAWTLAKSSDPATGSTVLPGDTVTYKLTVTNTGQVPVVGAGATDDLSAVVDNATLVEPLASGLTKSVDGKTLTWAVPDVAVGGTAEVTYQAKVDSGAYGVTLKNVVTPEGPGGECEENCSTEHPTPKWTLVKTSDPVSGSAVLPGEQIKYTLVAQNTSDAVLSGAKAVDDLSDVLNNATMVSHDAALSLSGTSMTWTLPDLGPGQIATVSYTVEVNEGAYGVTLHNVVSGLGDVPVEECPVDGVAAAAVQVTNNTCRETEHFVQAWVVDKIADVDSGELVQPESFLTYTLTARNTGPIPLVGATAVDDLSGVLPLANLVKPLDSSLSLSADGQSLTWAIPTLGVGESATVSYQVQVIVKTTGDDIFNVVTPGDPSGTCNEEVGCETDHLTPIVEDTDEPDEPTDVLAFTGANGFGAALIGLGLLGAGGLAVVATRRRNDNEGRRFH